MFGKSNQQEPDREFFAIYDTKVSAYWEPRMAINRQDAIRQLHNLMGNKRDREDSPLYLNAEDYQLFKVGEFFKKSGEIQGCKPEHIANLHEIKSAALRAESTGH